MKLGSKRRSAGNALGKLGLHLPQAVLALADCLEGFDRVAHVPAIRTLAKLGMNAAPAVPTLMSCLKYRDHYNVDRERIVCSQVRSNSKSGWTSSRANFCSSFLYQQ